MDPITSALVKEFSTAQGITEYGEDKQFEHFAAHCIVSERYEDEFDTSDMVVGEGQDLNVDAFAIKINGRLATDAEFIDDLVALNGYLEVEFIIIQAKTSSSFDGAALIALGDNLANEIFAEHQTMPANQDVQRLIAMKERIFSHAGKLKENPLCKVYYVCTGTWKDDEYLVAAIDRKKRDLLDTNLFSSVNFLPIGAREIQDLYRATRTSISREITFSSLVTLPAIDNVKASYLGVLPHTEFLKLISDREDEIVKSVFVDNVRDFQGENPVNADIAATIKEGLLDQFVLRNNGITIVARDIKVTSNQFTLIDYQIVNGCQTSHVIFANKDLIDGQLLVPIKLIHTEDEDVSQSIIKSTNKQTKVEENDLLALTHFQRGLAD
jgi:hypothetical protein